MNCLPDPCRACNKMAAPAGNSWSWTIIPAWNTAMEKIVRQNERLGIAAPTALYVAAPRGILSGAVTNAAMHPTAIVTLPEAQTRPCAYRINARVESITANAQL